MRKVTGTILAIVMVVSSAAGQSPGDPRDSLLTLVEKARNDSVRFQALISLVEAHETTDPRSALKYGESALKVADKGGMEIPATLYLSMARAGEEAGRSREAIRYLESAMLTYERQGKQDKATETYLSLGDLHYRNGDFTEAREIFGDILDNDRLRATAGQRADAIYGISAIHGALGNEEEQLLALQDFIKISEPGRRKAVAYLLIADILRESERFGQSIDYYYRSIEASRVLQDTILMALAMNHLAWGFYETGDLEKSLEYYQKNLDISIPANRTLAITNIYGNIGNIYRDWKDYEKALEYYDKSLDMSNEIGDLYNLSWLYEDIAKMYAGMGDYRKAFEYYQMHSQYNDSLQSQQYRNELSKARAGYEMEKNAREVEMLSLKLRQNQLLIYGLVGSLVAFVIISLLLIQRNRYRTKQRITAMDHRISELNQQNLRQQMNPHFIFNTLNSIQYYVFRNDKIASNNYMSKFATLMRKTLENSRHTAIPVKDEVDALELYLELESIRFKEKFEWKINFDEDIDLYLFKIPTMLIQPYVENAISHGLMHKDNGKGRVTIDLRMADGAILCTVEDNGVGRERASGLKTGEKNHHSLGTRITESRLKLVNELYGRKMRVKYTDLEDEEGNATGTRVEISIPIIT